MVSFREIMKEISIEFIVEVVAVILTYIISPFLIEILELNIQVWQVILVVLAVLASEHLILRVTKRKGGFHVATAYRRPRDNLAICDVKMFGVEWNKLLGTHNITTIRLSVEYRD